MLILKTKHYLQRNMELDEEALRKLLAADHVQRPGRTLSERLRSGEVMTVRMNDGGRVTLSDTYMARRTLWELFGWSTAVPAARLL